MVNLGGLCYQTKNFNRGEELGTDIDNNKRSQSVIVNRSVEHVVMDFISDGSSVQLNH